MTRLQLLESLNLGNSQIASPSPKARKALILRIYQVEPPSQKAMKSLIAGFSGIEGFRRLGKSDTMARYSFEPQQGKFGCFPAKQTRRATVARRQSVIPARVEARLVCKSIGKPDERQKPPQRKSPHREEANAAGRARGGIKTCL